MDNVIVFLKILPAKIRGLEGTVEVIVFLDEGSILRLIYQGVSDAIGSHNKKSSVSNWLETSIVTA